MLGAHGDAGVMAIARVVECRIQPTGLYEIRLEFSSLGGDHKDRLREWMHDSGAQQAAF